MHTKKKISVLMGVYNCESTLRDAVLSIENQTYTNWELIICDDGSEDQTFAIARELAKTDKRIHLLKNRQNMGLNRTLNHCLSVANGDFVARMDGDDISLPYRFEKQVQFLESQSQYSIVSSPMLFFDSEGQWGRNYVKAYPQKEDIVSGNPICHAPVMMWKSCIDKVGGYSQNARVLRVEDVDLWIKLYLAGFRCYNLSEPLYMMRNDKNALNRRKYRYRLNSTYVRLMGCRSMKLSPKYYLVSFKPMLYGLVPAGIRLMIRRKISYAKGSEKKENTVSNP